MTNGRRYNYLEMKEPNERTLLIPKLDSFDDALPYVGDFGRYQKLLLFALLPYGITYSILYFSQIFLTLVPREHWCKIDELEEIFTPEQRIQVGILPTRKYPFYQTCARKDLNFSSIIAQGIVDPTSPAWSTNKTVRCQNWEYDYTQVPYASIGAELDWVCERGYLISTAQAIFYGGSIVGGFLFGWIADHRGRIPALLMCTFCGFVGSVATASSDSFWSFALCRFVTGLAFDNVINIPLITVLEYMGVRSRTIVVNMAFGVYFGLGSTLLPWVAYYIDDWRILSYVTAAPLACCFITPWIIPESARWYVSNRKSEKVIKKLRRIASVNKIKPDPHFYEIFHRNLTLKEGIKERATLFDLFRSPRLARTTVILTLYWSLVLMAFDGHVYSLKLLEGSVFVSFSLACATELPAALLLTLLLDRWGRRFCGFITMASTTAFTIVELLVESGTTKLIMSICSRFALNMAANVGLQYAAELLPTPVRTQGVGMIHIFGILAHSIAPYIIDTVQIWADMPMAIIIAVSFISASLVLFLPETSGYDMPQTLQQGEDFGKDQRFWSIPCCEHTDDDNNMLKRTFVH